MKISTTPTDCIIIKACTNSDWDNVDFALLKINWVFTDWLSRMHKLAKDLSDQHKGFYCIQFWADTDGFFQYPEEFYIDEQDPKDLFSSQGFVYVELEEGEPESFPLPENSLDTPSVKFTDEGVQFKCYGKHTSEEFWTETIDPQILIQNMVKIAVNKPS